MTDQLLYASPVPSESKIRSEQEISRQLSTSGVLGGGSGSVESISVDPGTDILVGHVKGQYSVTIARELEEIFGASTIGEVPLFGIEEVTERDGYYSLSNINIQRPEPSSDAIHRFDGRLRKQGTRTSHYRALRVRPQDVTNPFGAGLTERVHLDSLAEDVQWFDPRGAQAEDATIQSTQAGEQSGFDEYDVTEPSFSANETYFLAYSLPYIREYQSDPRVWDDYNRSKIQYAEYDGSTVGNSTVGNATVGSGGVVEVASTWQRVYSTAHEFVGSPVIENGRIRLEPDTSDGILRAYEWDDTDSIYAIVQLGNSSWRLRSVDLRRVGLERIVVRFRFEDTASPGTYAPLDATVQRGAPTVLFEKPPNASSTPAGLVTRLDPIAYGSDRAVGETASVVKKNEVDG